jgi:hypothetical protein
MRTLLVKSSVIGIIALVMGSGLTLASASSKPGMFLYPLKQTTQKVTSAFTNGPNNVTPVIIVTQNAGPEEPELTSDDPSGDNEDNAARQISFPTPAQVHRPILTVTSSAKGPVATQASPAEEATAAAPPTPAHAVDVINLITQPGHDLESDVGAADNGQSSGTTPTDAPMDNSVNHDESQDDTASDHSLSSAPDSHVDDSQSKDSADHDQPAGSPDANSGDHQDETHADSSSHHESQDNSNHDD